jgi:hypothetical protein
MEGQSAAGAVDETQALDTTVRQRGGIVPQGLPLLCAAYAIRLDAEDSR